MTYLRQSSVHAAWVFAAMVQECDRKCEEECTCSLTQNMHACSLHVCTLCTHVGPFAPNSVESKHRRVVQVVCKHVQALRLLFSRADECSSEARFVQSLVRTRVSCARVHASLLINNVSLVMPSSMLACYCSCSRMLLFMSCFSAPSMLACWHAGMVSPVASSAFQQSRSVNREAAFGCVSAVQR